MKETNFTPGPWQVVEAKDGGQYATDAAGFEIAVTSYDNAFNIQWLNENSDTQHWSSDTNSSVKERPYSEADANATLIAAAPDLYDALNALAVCM